MYHQNHKVVRVLDVATQENINFDVFSISKTILIIAERFPDAIILWCEMSCISKLNLDVIPELFHHKKLLLSYSPDNYFSSEIGYVDESPFINVNKKVSYPTWQMSGLVGGIASSVLIALKNQVICEANFDYFLCSLAKLGMPLGLLCYSEPKLLQNHEINIKTNFGNRVKLFQFVKQHYKTRWVFLLVFNLAIYEFEFPLIPLLFSFFYKDRTNVNLNLDLISVQSSQKVVNKRSLDVIIPTIGRKKYLFDVLKDFSNQILLPNKIIIVEQNPIEASQTELDYILDEKWPFEIQHFFIHQAGACNARNMALEQTQSEWVFLADDDNRFEPTLLSDVFDKIQQYGAEVVTASYPQANEIKKYSHVIQWSTFGAGCSFVKRELLEKVKFNMGFEFGYGEDSDFGMQLRNQGADILYLPEPSILHLKAPIGGFRTKPPLQWQEDNVQPKPSPTVMLFQIVHNTQEQIRGYKTILFFKYYKHQKIKNPIAYFINFQKQWDKSVFWANQLKQQNEV